MKPRRAVDTDAALGVRTAALLVDLALLAILACPLLAMQRLRGAADGWLEWAVLVYFATGESWGGTLGKRVLSLHVETLDGEPVGYWRALLRNLAKAVAIGLFPVAVVLVLASERKRSLHDLLAGTVVRRRLALADAPASRKGLAIAVAILLPLVGVAAVQRYGRRVYDSTAASRAVSQRFDEPLAAYPDLDARSFFSEQHARCFDESYALSWVWNHFDELAYRRCLGRRYAEKMAEALVLEEASFTPHDGPTWAKLEFTVRLNKGRLPGEIATHEETECSSRGRSSGGSQILRSDFKEISPGVYRAHTLVGLQPGSCRLSFWMLTGSWPLGPPLVVALPTPDPVLVRAEEDKRRQIFEAQQREWQCVLSAKQQLPALAPTYTDDGTDPLSDAVRKLRSDDVSVRQRGAMAMKPLGLAARSAVGELLRALSDTNENTKDYVIQAMVAADPAGTLVAPALRCLSDEPKTYVRIRAAAALAAIHDPTAVAALDKELQSPDENIRTGVVRLARDFSLHDKGVVSLLAARLRTDSSARVRVTCAETLPWLDPNSEDMMAAVTAALNDPVAEVREAATTALHDIPQIRSRR